MYHPIQKPNCADPLDRFAEIVQLALAFALDKEIDTLLPDTGSSVTATQLRDKLSPKLLRDQGPRFISRVHQNFIKYFEDNGKRAAGEWLWGKPVHVMAHLVHLLALPLTAKQDILRAFTEELDLEARFATGRLSYLGVRDSPDCQQALALVQAVMYSFYDKVLADKGVRRDLINVDEDFTRQHVVEAYTRANLGLHVCPGCDGPGPPITGSVIHAELDHFFPLSKYPFLSVHRLNLTPLCKDCNQVFKRDKDPLDAPGVSALADIYHPYFLPAKEHVDVVVDRDESNIPRVKLKPKETGPEHERRLASLNHLLCLEARWDGELGSGRLKSVITGFLRHITQDERPMLGGLDMNWLLEKVSRIITTIGGMVGQHDKYVPALAYAHWIARDADAALELLRESAIALPTPTVAANFKKGTAGIPETGDRP